MEAVSCLEVGVRGSKDELTPSNDSPSIGDATWQDLIHTDRPLSNCARTPDRGRSRRWILGGSSGHELVQNLDGVIRHFNCEYETICPNLYGE